MTSTAELWLGVGFTAALSVLSLASTWGVLKWRLKHAEENVQKLWERYDLCSSLQTDRFQRLDKHLDKLDTIVELLKEQQKELKQIRNGKANGAAAPPPPQKDKP